MNTALELKYVIIDGTFPIIFISQKHIEMKVHGNITSAGFLTIRNNKVSTYGKSHSLKMVPDSHDARTLEIFLGLDNS